MFVFGLSFLGVWEIPIPGFVGSDAAGKLSAREGYSGAFCKGILTTLLATPCAGPLLIPAVTWAIAQPAWLTYLTFAALGLGMASPFLIIGAVPRLINALPKPGVWMNTFKQLMGFLMMGTVVFLTNSVGQYITAVLTFVVSLGLACWWFGLTPLTAEFGQRVKAWSVTAAIVALGIYFSFYVLIPQHELAWQPYSKAIMEEHLAEGRTVFVNFTAEWCATCKTNEEVALNVKKTKNYFKENGIIALKADRDKNPEVDQQLIELGNTARGLPYYAIFSGATNESVHFGGNYITSQTVLNAIESVQGDNVDQSKEKSEVADALPSKLK